MAKIELPYITRDKDRHGNLRLYYRRHGRKLRLRGPEGSQIFLQDYQMASAGIDPRGKKSTPLHRTKVGTVHDLIRLYFESAAYKTLAPRTRHVRRQILERFCIQNGDGDKPYALIEPKHLLVRRDAIADRPEAANGMIKALRQVFDFAIEYGHHSSNPARAVKMMSGSSVGIPAWTQEDIEHYVAVHPFGTMAHLAMALALFTGQRKSDLIRLGPSHIRTHVGREGLQFTQQKNRDRKAVDLWVPIAPDLHEIIVATKTGRDAFLTTEFGRPFSEGGFGNRFRKWCDEAGLTNRSVHGLRKTAAAILAENGCTEQEIMAITGHRTSKEVIRYTPKRKTENPRCECH